MNDGVQRLIAEPSLSSGLLFRGAPSRTLRVHLALSVVLGDLAAIMLGILVAWFVKPDPAALVALLAVTLPIYAGTALNSRAFAISTLRRGSGGVSIALRSLAFSFAALFLLVYFIRSEQFIPRSMLLTTMVASALLLAGFRIAVGSYIRRHLNDRLLAEMVIFDRAHTHVPDRMIQIDAETTGITPDLTDPAALHRFGELVRDMDRVVIVCEPEARADWAMMLKGANVLGEVMVDDIGSFGAFGISAVAHHPTLLVASGPLTLSQRVTKRLFDLALCIPALIALAPVLLLTALAVKLDSRGPVFFRQRRVGRGNAFFEILKFRSMHVAECDADGNVSAGRSDSRVTRVGRFIRSTSIDELPQLFNVVFGSMSLVGPRPHALGSLAGTQLFWEIDNRYWHRHACKPGLTGLAQVRGFRGATHRREDLTNRLQADLEYLNGWSIWRDISIIFATLRVVVHRNAF